MLRRLIGYSLIAVIMSTFGTYLYFRGMTDGEWKYKQSTRMTKALKSAYHFGYMDGKEGKRESWDGPELHTHAYCTNCNVSPVCVANATEDDIYALVDMINRDSKYFKFHVSGLPHQPRWITLDGKECV